LTTFATKKKQYKWKKDGKDAVISGVPKNLNTGNMQYSTMGLDTSWFNAACRQVFCRSASVGPMTRVLWSLYCSKMPLRSQYKKTIFMQTYITPWTIIVEATKNNRSES